MFLLGHAIEAAIALYETLRGLWLMLRERVVCEAGCACGSPDVAGVYGDKPVCRKCFTMQGGSNNDGQPWGEFD